MYQSVEREREMNEQRRNGGMKEPERVDSMSLHTDSATKILREFIFSPRFDLLVLVSKPSAVWLVRKFRGGSKMRERTIWELWTSFRYVWRELFGCQVVPEQSIRAV